MIERAGAIKIATHALQSSLIVVSGLKSSCGSKVHRRKEKLQKKPPATYRCLITRLRRPLKTSDHFPLTPSSRPQVDRKSEDLELLEKASLPLTLNLSQCLLELQQHQRVVELNDQLLKKHKGNTNVQICAFHKKTLRLEWTLAPTQLERRIILYLIFPVSTKTPFLRRPCFL